MTDPKNPPLLPYEHRLVNLGNKLKEEGMEYILIVNKDGKTEMLIDESADRRFLRSMIRSAESFIENRLNVDKRNS